MKSRRQERGRLSGAGQEEMAAEGVRAEGVSRIWEQVEEGVRELGYSVSCLGWTPSGSGAGVSAPALVQLSLHHITWHSPLPSLHCHSPACSALVSGVRPIVTCPLCCHWGWNPSKDLLTSLLPSTFTSFYYSPFVLYFCLLHSPI